ncbi:MAG: Uma2 family endonuclease [Rhizobiaceae bacterium]
MGALPKTSMALPEFLSWWEKQGEGERFELVDGHVYAMGRDKVGHNLAKLRAVNALQSALRDANVDYTAYTDGVGVSPNNKNFRLPDASVNCGAVDSDSSILPNPLIVVEVVSPSSEERNVHEKMIDYFSINSICHYLIVYLDRHFVVHHSRSNANAKVETTFVSTGVIDLTPPGVSIAVADLFGEVDR